LERRDFFKAATLAAVPAMTTGSSTALASLTERTVSLGTPAAEVLHDAPPMSLERAYEVMDRLKLDGLVVVDPVNVYHMTGFWPVTSRMGFTPSLYALLSRDASQPITVVSNEFAYYYLLSDNRYAYPMQVFLFSGPADYAALAAAKAGGFRQDPASMATMVWPDTGKEPLEEYQRLRREAVARAVAERPMSADAEFALVKALRALGFTRGRIAVDNSAIRSTFEQANLPTEIVAADEAMKLIRMIKSPREIVLMRQAATANVEAVLAAIKTAREGATYRELRANYYAEAARRGNRGVFMVINGISAEGVDATFRDGDAFLFDAVSEGAGYHGDFARTVFLGEPAGTMKTATEAIKLGWDAVRAALRPGMRFSEITALGKNTLRKAGFDFEVPFGPHSVGLYHTDSPGLGDIVLEPNMVLSVDCPVTQVGIGGTAHLEDLMLITATGAEPLHPLTSNIIQI